MHYKHTLLPLGLVTPAHRFTDLRSPLHLHSHFIGMKRKQTKNFSSIQGQFELGGKNMVVCLSLPHFKTE